MTRAKRAPTHSALPPRELVAPAQRDDRLRVLEQMQRAVFAFARQIGGSSSESTQAFMQARQHTREVARYAPAYNVDELLVPYAQLLDIWFNEAAYLDSRGQPRDLAVHGTHGFATLAKRCVPHTPLRTVLRSLLMLGAVSENAHGRLRPSGRCFLIPQLTAVALDRVPVAMDRLLSTFAYNLIRGANIPAAGKPHAAQRRHQRLERSAYVANLPQKDLRAFDTMIKGLGATLITQADTWLMRREREARASQDGAGKTVTAGVNIFAFAKPNNPTPEPAE